MISRVGSEVKHSHLADCGALHNCSVAHPTCHNLPMCGRYRLSRRKQVVEEYFDTVSGEEDWSPRYNIAPTQPIPVIRQHTKEPIRSGGNGRGTLIVALLPIGTTASIDIA
jgi:hypothetical protein